MEHHSGGSGAAANSNVPAFLTKLWTLVEDPETDPLICWSPNGNSFYVFDQGRFSKEVLPKYFKHNNMASFVRQLNMYGFRKVVHIEQGGLVKPEKDETEFQHPYFVRGQEQLLENIKRKVTNVSNIKLDDMKLSTDEISKVLNDVQHMKGRQESMDSKITAMKHENEALWREVASLRQKHSQQQKVVNKLIQFLVTLVQSNRVMGMKRKMPLMLNDSSAAHSMPKYSRQFSLESSPAISASSAAFSAANLFASDGPLKTGPVISDITELAQSSSSGTSEWIDDSPIPVVHVKEEPLSPAHDPEVIEVEVGAESLVPADTPLSPTTTFINSILQEGEPAAPAPPTPDPIPAAAAAPTPTPPLFSSNQRCLSLVCLDKTELCDHLESIDTDLENLQQILNAQSINFESSPIFDILSTSTINTDFDLDSLATIQDLLSDQPKETVSSGNSTDSGKQIVQYTAQPALLVDQISTETTVEDLPILLELEQNPYFEEDPAEESAISILSSNYQTECPKKS
ncbi:heat shock factor protein 1 isoform X2 [Denticeps clupeoides]|uniref:HSF-type DNA-binding domain-containing protein n=1 Tax=Denticeps clupeoides TaxID=299321 RepID=A0AAY4E629_9TELE|nr:heat shock factor protein 1 isoform X2 [Denticeps clupeoides]